MGAGGKGRVTCPGTPRCWTTSDLRGVRKRIGQFCKAYGARAAGNFRVVAVYVGRTYLDCCLSTSADDAAVRGAATEHRSRADANAIPIT